MERPNANDRSSNSFTASRGRSPTGASPTATSPRRPTANSSIASFPGCASISTGRSIPPSGSTSVCSINTVSKGPSATGVGIPTRWKSSSPTTPTSIRRARPVSSSRSMTTWSRSWAWPRPRPCSSSSAAARAPTFPRFARIAKSSPAAASRAAPSRSCGSMTRSRPW